MVRNFDMNQLSLIQKFYSVCDKVTIHDVFESDYFIAFLTDQKVARIVLDALKKVFGKKVFIFVKYPNPLDFIKQFSRGVFEHDGNNTVKVWMAKKFFLCMTYFLKRNYKNVEFKFIFEPPSKNVQSDTQELE